MKPTARIFLFTCFFSSMLVAETSEYTFESYMNRDYHVTDKNILPLAYYIIASKPQTLEEGFMYLRTGNEEPVKSIKVFSIMGTLLSAYPTNEYNTDIEAYVEDIESSYEHYSEIVKSYSTLARIGTDQTLQMLQERATYEFWEGREMPSLTSAFSDRPNEPYTSNAQSAAITDLGRHRSPEAKAFLEALQKDRRYLEDPILQVNESFRMGLEATKWIGERQEQIDKALALKQSIFGPKPTTATATPKPDRQIPAIPPAPAFAENSKEDATPEAATEEPKQPAPYWLWLVGLSVLLLVLAVPLLRKKKHE